jgi:hypothetical protein
MPRLLSVNVGLPRDVTWNGKTVRTSVWKSPVTGRRVASSISMVMRKPISPVTAGSIAPFLFIRWTPITTGNPGLANEEQRHLS